MEQINTYRLKIFRADNSAYWTEHFNSLEYLNKWLAEEQNRPYWETTWTWHIFELDNQGNEIAI